MQTRITILFEDTTGEVTLQAENLPDGQAALFRVGRALSTALCTVHDQLEEKRLVIAKQFKPSLRG